MHLIQRPWGHLTNHHHLIGHGQIDGLAIPLLEETGDSEADLQGLGDSSVTVGKQACLHHLVLPMLDSVYTPSSLHLSLFS